MIRGAFRIWLVVCMLCAAPTALAQSVPVTSGLRLWLDAADVNAGGAQPANGATVAVWKDKSGNGNNLTATGAPTFESAGMGGKASIRLPANTSFSGANIFTGATSAQTTMFFVHANVTLTNNFAINLNGTTTAGSGRFSVHMPWGVSGNTYYFDAGDATTGRISGTYPVGLTAPVVVAVGNSTTAYSGMTNVKQFVRFNGTTNVSDGTALTPVVSGGINIGSITTTYPYNGRFSELIVYDRALSLSEIQSVECYLAAKWAITGSSSCPPITNANLAISKSNGVTQVYSGTSMTYSVVVKNNGPDAVSGVVVVDTPGGGITCPLGNVVSITGNGVPSGSFTVGNLTSSGITLGNLLSGQSATLTYACQVN